MINSSSEWGKMVHISTIFALLSIAIVSNLILALRLANASLSVRQLQFSQGAALPFSEMFMMATPEQSVKWKALWNKPWGETWILNWMMAATRKHLRSCATWICLSADYGRVSLREQGRYDGTIASGFISCTWSHYVPRHASGLGFAWVDPVMGRRTLP